MTTEIARSNRITWIAANFPKKILQALYLYIVDHLTEGQVLDLGVPLTVEVKYELMNAHNSDLSGYLQFLGALEGDVVFVPGVEFEEPA